MKFHKFLNEQYLSSQFKFGFELEALYNTKFMSTPDEFKIKENYYETIKNNLDNLLGLGTGNVTDDETIESSNKNISFEYKSSILDFNPATIQKFFKFLYALRDNGILTNSSCGFHIHISYPDISIKDIIWIIINIVSDEKLLEEYTEFNNIAFYDRIYAKKMFISNIEHYLHSYLEYRNKGTLELLNIALDEFINEKYNIFSIRKNFGTLEWRGPRNFLNKKNLIKKFIILFWKFIRTLSKFQYSKKIVIHNKEYTRDYILSLFDKIDFKKYSSGTYFDKKLKSSKNYKFNTNQSKEEINKIFKYFPWLNKITMEDVLLNIMKFNEKKYLKIINGTFENGILKDCYFSENSSVRILSSTINHSIILNGYFFTCKLNNVTIVDGIFEDCEFNSIKMTHEAEKLFKFNDISKFNLFYDKIKNSDIMKYVTISKHKNIIAIN